MTDRRPTLCAAILACAALLPAQGTPYAFAEREPRTALERAIAARLPSLVKVHGASGLSTIIPYAAGVIVSDQGHVLTLDLVMIQRDQTRVVLADGSIHLAEILPPDPKLGVRLLKIDPAACRMPLQPLELADDVPSNGTFVFSIGNAFRLAEFSEKLSTTFGMVSATTTTGLRYQLDDVDYDGRLILTDAANNPGHYGGALFSLDGRWIGLNARIVESTETNTLVSAAIPTVDLQAYVDRWTRPQDAGGGAAVAIGPDPDADRVDPGYHGIVLFDHGGRRSPPAYVERCERGSPGGTAGLRPDDLIVRVGDRTVRSCQEFGEEMAKHPAGARVELTWKRGSAVRRATLTLEEPKQ